MGVLGSLCWGEPRVEHPSGLDVTATDNRSGPQGMGPYGHGGANLLALRGDAGVNEPVFASRKGGGHLTERMYTAVLRMVFARPSPAGCRSPWQGVSASGRH